MFYSIFMKFLIITITIDCFVVYKKKNPVNFSVLLFEMKGYNLFFSMYTDFS